MTRGIPSSMRKALELSMTTAPAAAAAGANSRERAAPAKLSRPSTTSSTTLMLKAWAMRSMIGISASARPPRRTFSSVSRTTATLRRDLTLSSLSRISLSDWPARAALAGRFESARSHSAEATQVAIRMSDPFAVAASGCFATVLALMRGDPREIPAGYPPACRWRESGRRCVHRWSPALP